MLQVFYSNHLERLVDALVEATTLERKRLKLSPFDRTPVVVPNWNVEAYLKFEVARRKGIAAHMEYRQLIEFFESLLPTSGEYRILDDQTLQLLLIDALGDKKLLARKDLAPVQGYLSAAGDDRDSLELRRFQLSAHLAELFREYDYARPEMVAEWPESPQFRDPHWRRIERWQRALWLDLFAPDGRVAKLADEKGAAYIRLPEIFERVPADALQIPKSVHLFAMNKLGRVFEGLLGVLGERTEVHLWSLNPCREFWEDVVTDIDEEAELLSSKAVDGGQLVLAGAAPDLRDEDFWEPEKFPLPLRLWGRAGRDQVRMLNRLCGHDPRTLFEEPAIDSVLTQVQQDVLDLAPEREEPIDALDDDSITVLACPGIQREAEIIANEIWALMRGERHMWDDKPLQFNEIAVIVNRDQRVEYQTHLEAVFRDVYDIPFNIVDLQANADSRLVEALELLLDLPFGNFKRRELLKLLTHPNVIAKFDDVEPQTWLRWCDELNIFHGADHTDHADTYIERDLFNWDQGLKRLVLGGFMTGEPSGDDRAFRHEQFHYLPHEYAHGESTSAARLVMCARSLIADARRCRREEHTLAEWFERIGEMVENYLAPAHDDEEFEFMRCRRLLGDLADLDVTGRKMPYRVAREFLGRALGELEGRRGQYLADGVVVSSFLPARPMPFRAVFVAGMGESYFPSSDGGDPLDLRQVKWQEGDAGRRDRDKYAFLQTLLSTRERFYASYVSRDSRTGEALEPSSVVRDLLHMLEQSYLGREKTAACVREHPLRRFDAAYFDRDDSDEESEFGTVYHPEARREAAAFALRESLREHCRRYNVPFPELPILEKAVAEPLRNQVGAVLGTYAQPKAQAPDEDLLEVSLSFSQLRQFLESPLQASARWILGLRSDDDQDLLDVEDEVFESSYVSSLLFARDVFWETITEHAPDDNPAFLPIYEQKARYLELKGELPTGPFHEGERKKQLELLETWRANLAKLGVPGEAPLEVKRIGRAERHAPLDEIWDSISFELVLDDQPVRVELYGETEALDNTHGTAVTLVSRSRVKDKDFLRGFFTQVGLAASGKIDEDRPFDLVVAPGKSLARARKLSKYKKRLAPISQADALAYLETLTADFLSGVHAYLMPIEAVFEYFDPENETPFDELVEMQLNNRWSTCSSEYGPVRQPARFEAPQDADRLLQRRYAPFFKRLGGGE
ncbi:exonuclease V subunit gamma [Persicimonas caeni]|uniref:Exonuclease V subunit gamma n=1 Tax=Persicimonas caeni TaxID=2292766 RepID=A0A4Y6PTU7_PERCE|nr:exodeoxyribonuclease V subunit gamma [Persicimonas caeni]QDG51754.1 exonuclease V subunit gamma [Persicimonas caeni]QED32975.1 exonuclease V subunit gamma [Persicimonas caeni]